MIINTTSIVQMCAKYAALSSNQAGLQTADFLNFANLVMSGLSSELLTAREEYLIFSESVAVAAGAAYVRIPYRAINGELRHLWWESGDTTRTRLDYHPIEDIENYETDSVGSPNGFYIMGNYVVLLPAPQVAGSLVMAYPFRPNTLVDGSTTATATVVSGAVNTAITVANVPTNFVSGAMFDVIDARSGNGILYYDKVGTIVGNVITFVGLLPLAGVGCYVCAAGESPVPMLPEEAHPLLLESALMRLEMVRGNSARIKNSAAIIADARKAWDLLLINRVSSKSPPSGNGGPQFPSRPY